jgi:ABC-2 type transport system permease protein
MKARWIALRVIQEIVRDRRTLAFFLVVPVLVMTLVYYAIYQDEVAKVAVLSRGMARLFSYDLERALQKEKNVAVTPLPIPDEEQDPAVLERLIRDAMRRRVVDGVLYFPERLITDRFDGKAGTLLLYVEGSRPTLTGTVGSAVGNAMSDLAAALPVVIDAQCSARCANSVNNKAIDLKKVYLYGDEDYRLVDFFLPVLLPFFVFFFTFLLSTITFQRERVRGTLERLLISPITFTDIVLGYLGGFFLFSTLQMSIVLTYILLLITYPVTFWQVASLVAVSLAVMMTGLLLGLLVSFQAHNEFQAVQFIPLVILPQIFLSDMIWSLDSFPAPFRWFAMLLPLTHANAIARDLMLKQQPLWALWPNLLALAALFATVLTLLGWAGRRSRGMFT